MKTAGRENTDVWGAVPQLQGLVSLLAGRNAHAGAFEK